MKAWHQLLPEKEQKNLQTAQEAHSEMQNIHKNKARRAS